MGKKINIYGEFVNDNQFTIKEYAGDDFTGSFTGAFADANHIKGTWSDPKNVKNLSFEVKSDAITPDKSGWTGAWHLNDTWDGGTLLIGGVTKDSLKFALSVVRSAHIGEIWGTAKRIGNQAVFKQVEFPMEGEENPEACHLIFEFKGDYIQIEQQSSGLACGFGMRAYASGRFDNKVIEIKPTLSFGEGEDKIFPNQAIHNGFQRLVGTKYYDVFAYNMQGFCRLGWHD
ncbi:MAG: hypothetical protein IPJ74_06460 [Saprospiraceae bacterium]|nr:hypothetical protein [Saprospiraceae bacterium]